MNETLSINHNGNWRLYTHAIPWGHVCGTITRNGSDTGALVRMADTGVFVQINGGAVRSLDQRQVMAELSAEVSGL